MSNANDALFATAPPGLEGVLADEVRALGHRPLALPDHVRWETAAGARGYQDANLRLRTAHRIWLRLAEAPTGPGVRWVEAFTASALRRVWDGRLPARLEVEGAGTSGGQVARAARKRLGLGPDSGGATAVGDPGEPKDAVRLQLRIWRGRAELFVDTSGEPLHRRGWRQEISRAPLRETLASGLLSLAGWREESEPLWDGLCGSGSIVIEAALRARHRAAGVGRPFAFERWPDFDKAAWDAKVARAQREERAGAAGRLFASDLHAGALGTARRNARRAGVETDLTLTRADVARFERPPGVGPGLWLSNLPYGKRVGQRGELAGLYRAVAGAWKRALPGWRAGFLVEDTGLLEEAFGRAPSERFSLTNGGLRCALLLWRP